MQTTVLSRVATGERLAITYATPLEVSLFPSFSPEPDNPQVRMRRAWFDYQFAELHQMWQRAGGYECDGGLLYDLTIPGGWFAEMRPNPGDILIIEAGWVGKKPSSRKAWGNELVAQALMIDLLLCHETKEPVFQRLTSDVFSYFQILLPARGRVYGLRKTAGPSQGRIEARRLVEA